jgi:hypothetical protein
MSFIKVTMHFGPKQQFMCYRAVMKSHHPTIDAFALTCECSAQGKDLWQLWLQAALLTLDPHGSGWQQHPGLTQGTGFSGLLLSGAATYMMFKFHVIFFSGKGANTVSAMLCDGDVVGSGGCGTCRGMQRCSAG